ncbi:hypothetical protein ACFL96_04695 [Thermoproteota archaeon]
MNGINRLCRHCRETCKQWEQVKVVRCPGYQFSGTQDVCGQREGQNATFDRRETKP